MYNAPVDVYVAGVISGKGIFVQDKFDAGAVTMEYRGLGEPMRRRTRERWNSVQRAEIKSTLCRFIP